MKTKDQPCHTCNGRGYHIESTYEADGTLYREKIPCFCCDGLGVNREIFIVPPKIKTRVKMPSSWK